MKLSCKKVIFIFVILILPLIASGQAINPLKNKSTQRKEARIKRQRKIEYQRGRKKVLKARFEMQTKEVQERMKTSKKEASKFYQKESFLKRLYRKIKKVWKT